MSEMQAIMKFELLPNEILMECFKYLNAFDIFYAFDFLNSRLYNLIRNIPLHLSIEHMKKSTLVQFCIKMLLNSQMKKQIMSLKLSKKNMFNVIETFFSFISLDELAQLRSLELIDLGYKTVSQISSILGLLTNLRYFRISGSSSEIQEILNSLPASTIKTLSIPKLDDDFPLKHTFTSLVNLIVFDCSLENLCYFFKYSPNLRYLSIDDIVAYYKISDNLRLPNKHAIHLKRLVIKRFEDTFECLETLLKRTPNLTLLIISARGNTEIINAWSWQNFITTSLPLLDVFKFKFSIHFENEVNDIVDKFQQFQTDFWHQQHHWYTEWIFNKDTGVIYTIPYISNEYDITPYTKRCYNESFNNASTFVNVTDLKLCPEALSDIYQYHFPNVKSLRLAKGRANDNYLYPFFKPKQVQCLKMIVNLRNLTHLDISFECRWKSSSVLLQLLQEVPCLSSLKIDKGTLFSLFNNRALCECFKKMIKRLDISNSYSSRFLEISEIVKICRVFSNMQEFWCIIGQQDNLGMILNQLSKLSYMKVFSYETSYSKNGDRWLKDHVLQLESYSFTIKCLTNSYYDDDYDYYSDYCSM